MKLKLDLHDVYNRGEDIDRALRSVIDEAVAKKAPLVEIIPGKGSGQLKKRVLRFLDQREIKAFYDRVEKDSHNFGRVFVHFRWKCPACLQCHRVAGPHGIVIENTLVAVFYRQPTSGVSASVVNPPVLCVPLRLLRCMFFEFGGVRGA